MFVARSWVSERALRGSMFVARKGVTSSGA